MEAAYADQYNRRMRECNLVFCKLFFWKRNNAFHALTEPIEQALQLYPMSLLIICTGSCEGVIT